MIRTWSLELGYLMVERRTLRKETRVAGYQGKNSEYQGIRLTFSFSVILISDSLFPDYLIS